jgi:hypothetical protein
MGKKLFIIIILAVTLASFTVSFTLAFLQQSQVSGGEKYKDLALKILAEASQLRDLNPPENFEVKVVSSSWVREHWGGKSEVSSENLEWKIYRALLLIPAEASPEEFETEWAELIIAASSGETLYIVSDRVEKLGENEILRILSHESSHILQYVNFNLPQPKTYDEKQALSALIEGDADLTADNLLKAKGFKPKTREPYRPNEINYKDAVFLLRYFPYEYGEDFVAYLYSRGGWKLVNTAYSNFPPSTEQIMHPEKYLAGEGFVEPKPPEVKVKGWILQGEDRLGEYFIQVFLARWIDWGEAESASEGWNGDKVYYYENGDGGFLLVWITIWDGEKDAEEYYWALTRALEQAGGVKISDGLWKVGEVYMSVKLSGIEVTLVSTNKIEVFKQIGWNNSSFLFDLNVNQLTQESYSNSIFLP